VFSLQNPEYIWKCVMEWKERGSKLFLFFNWFMLFK